MELITIDLTAHWTSNQVCSRDFISSSQSSLWAIEIKVLDLYLLLLVVTIMSILWTIWMFKYTNMYLMLSYLKHSCLNQTLHSATLAHKIIPNPRVTSTDQFFIQTTSHQHPLTWILLLMNPPLAIKKLEHLNKLIQIWSLMIWPWSPSLVARRPQRSTSTKTALVEISKGNWSSVISVLIANHSHTCQGNADHARKSSASLVKRIYCKIRKRNVNKSWAQAPVTWLMTRSLTAPLAQMPMAIKMYHCSRSTRTFKTLSTSASCHIDAIETKHHLHGNQLKIYTTM